VSVTLYLYTYQYAEACIHLLCSVGFTVYNIGYVLVAFSPRSDIYYNTIQYNIKLITRHM